MAEEIVRNPAALSSPSPVELRCPEWFLGDFYCGKHLFPEVICWHHNDVCLAIDYDIRRLRRQSHPQTTEEQEEEESEIRKKRAFELQRRSWTAGLVNKIPEVEGLEKKIPGVEGLEKKIPGVEGLEKNMLEETEERLEKNMLLETQGGEEKNMLEETQEGDGEGDEDADADADADGEGEGDEDEDEEEEEGPTWTFEEGKRYNISFLLSGRTTNRDYLINNKGLQVNIHQLSGKYVLLYIMSLPDDRRHYHYHRPDPSVYGDLEDIYTIFSPRGLVEIVFVALGNNNDVFSDSFSRMPWLAIPHNDQESRDIFKIDFDIPYPSPIRAVLFAPNGSLLLSNAIPMISRYGVHGFPFTNQHICVLLNECRALREELFLEKKMPPLTSLLGDYLISSDGNKVPVSRLERKVVGLFFFEPTSCGFEQCRQLLEIWKYLKNEHEEFEIVLINKKPFNLSYAKSEFKNKFGCCIPWYALEVCCRKLSRVFKKEWESETDAAGDFVVLKPDKYQNLSYFAFHILINFGRDAYPFTLERAVELTKRKQRDVLVLDKLLAPGAPLKRGGSTSYMEESDTTTVSGILGKRVLLLLATHSCYECGLFLSELKHMYKKRRLIDDFEIIYMSLDCNESPSSFFDCFKEMPWLVHSFVPEFSLALARSLFDVFPPRLPAIAAFGPDGHLETKESNLAFKSEFNAEYPFIKADMAEEVCGELTYQYLWDLDHLILASAFLRN